MGEYPLYKTSGVDWLGNIPQEWDVRRIKFLFEIRKRIAGEEGYTVFSITQKGFRVKDIESGEGQLAADYSKYQFVEVGDFAMNHMDLLTGGVDVAKVRGVTSPDYRVFTLINNDCSAEYFLYVFRHCYTNKIFYRLGQGSAQLGRWRFPAFQFNNFIVPIPSLGEQQAIADFLNHKTTQIDTLIEKKQRQIELLQEQRAALIYHAVTKGLNPDVQLKDSGVEWLGKIPSRWESTRIKSVIHTVTNGVWGDEPQDNEDDIICVRVADFDMASLGISDKKLTLRNISPSQQNGRLLSINDLLIEKSGGGDNQPVGRVVRFTLNQKSVCSNFVGVISVKVEKILPSYLLYALDNLNNNRVNARSIKQTTGIQNLDTYSYLCERIALPPMEEQQTIVSYLEKKISRINSLVSQISNQLKIYKDYRTALISEAVTGKIDVRTAV